MYTVDQEGYYRYTRDLKALDSRNCKGASQDHRLAAVKTPLNIAAWRKRLRTHQDADYTNYIVTGLEHRFHIGVAVFTTLNPAKKNMLSAEKNPQVVDDYLAKEVEAGNILGPFPLSSAPKAHINRFGVIPKKHQPGKWRLITDVSFPEGGCVNDGINPDHCPMVYTTVDQVAARAMSLGRGALLAKIDVKSAYQLVPICPRDRLYLGMQWKNAVYVDGMLPFGLRSAPKIFNALADGLEWCVEEEGVQHVFHYLDDFIVLGAAESPECSDSLCTSSTRVGNWASHWQRRSRTDLRLS